MQKNELSVGIYRLLLNAEETEKGYKNLPFFDKNDLNQAFFQHALKKAEEESLSFLKSMGIDPEKLTLVRPVSPPDEEGIVLYLCALPLCGKLLAGGDVFPRQSEEVKGLSVIFLSDENAFTPGLPRIFENEVEMRFVIPLSFDEEFFQDK